MEPAVNQKEKHALITKEFTTTKPSPNLVGQGTGDGAEGVTDLGTKQTHDSNHDDGDERENDSVLYKALAFFFRRKQHGIISFLKNDFV